MPIIIENLRIRIAQVITAVVFTPIVLLGMYSAFTGYMSAIELILFISPFMIIFLLLCIINRLIPNGKIIFIDNKIIIYNYSNEIIVAENRRKERSNFYKGLKPNITIINIDNIKVVVFGEYRGLSLLSREKQDKVMHSYLKNYEQAYKECKQKRYISYRYNYRGLDYTPFIYIQGNCGESYLIRIGYEYSERKTRELLSALKNSGVDIIEYVIHDI